MKKMNVASTIDHAVLKPGATDDVLKSECEIAMKYGVASVCVKPSHVELASELLKDSKVLVCTVIGFPHGATTTNCKVAESLEAIENGAEELDMVLNVGKLISGDKEYVKNDIQKVVEATHSKGKILKVILETALLTDEQKKIACKLSQEAGADFVKTSTGFNGGGATIEDIKLMKNCVSNNVQLKASGGIKTLEQALQYIEEGCARLGTSAVKQILEGEEYKGEY